MVIDHSTDESRVKKPRKQSSHQFVYQSYPTLKSYSNKMINNLKTGTNQSQFDSLTHYQDKNTQNQSIEKPIHRQTNKIDHNNVMTLSRIDKLSIQFDCEPDTHQDDKIQNNHHTDQMQWKRSSNNSVPPPSPPRSKRITSSQTINRATKTPSEAMALSTYTSHNCEFLNLNLNSSEVKQIQSDMFKNNYNKLQQRYKRQLQHDKNQQLRRMQLQSENRQLKVQLIKYKTRCQDFHQKLSIKRNKVTQLQKLVKTLQNEEYHKDQEFRQRRQHDMAELEDNIQKMQMERMISQQNAIKSQQEISKLRKEIDCLHVLVDDKARKPKCVERGDQTDDLKIRNRTERGNQTYGLNNNRTERGNQTDETSNQNLKIIKSLNDKNNEIKQQLDEQYKNNCKLHTDLAVANNLNYQLQVNISQLKINNQQLQNTYFTLTKQYDDAKLMIAQLKQSSNNQLLNLQTIKTNINQNEQLQIKINEMSVENTHKDQELTECYNSIKMKMQENHSICTQLEKMKEELNVSNNMIKNLEQYKKHMDQKVAELNVLYSAEVRKCKQTIQRVNKDIRERFAAMRLQFQKQMKVMLQSLLKRAVREQSQEFVDRLSRFFEIVDRQTHILIIKFITEPI